MLTMRQMTNTLGIGRTQVTNLEKMGVVTSTRDHKNHRLFENSAIDKVLTWRKEKADKFIEAAKTK